MRAEQTGFVRVADLVLRARTAASSVQPDLEKFGLIRLSGGMTHDVYVPIDEPSIVVKVFGASDAGPAECEWDALTVLGGTGLAPRPIRYEAGELPSVVMERVPGSLLAADALDAGHAAAIGEAHRLVHDAPSRRPREDPRERFRALQLWMMSTEQADSTWRSKEGGRVIGRAFRVARTWLSAADVDQVVSPDRLTFSRGDPNLSNYVWSENGVLLIDWENSGYNDPALELADMAEHASTRTLADAFWAEVADATQLTRTERQRFVQGRRAMACFWLLLIASRERTGLPTTVSLEDQAKRTLAALEA